MQFRTWTTKLVALGGFLAIFVGLTQVPTTNAESNTQDALRNEGKVLVTQYAETLGIATEENSVEYQTLLRDILNDNRPDLVNKDNAEAINAYILDLLDLGVDTETRDALWRRTGIPMVMAEGGTTAQDTPQEVSSAATVQSERNLNVGYDRWAARNYTYQYTAWWGGKSRNSSYPDFSSAGGDCTNFISQALVAGGLRQNGSHDDWLPTAHENTTSEWYVGRENDWRNWNGWNWSTSWSTVGGIRSYLRDRVSAYVEAYPANPEALALLISRAREGDIIQFDTRSCSWCGWSPTHAVMVSTKTNNGSYYTNDLTYNDHSGGPSGNDVRDGSLRSKFRDWQNQGVTNLRRFVWIRMW